MNIKSSEPKITKEYKDYPDGKYFYVGIEGSVWDEENKSNMNRFKLENVSRVDGYFQEDSIVESTIVLFNKAQQLEIEKLKICDKQTL